MLESSVTEDNLVTIENIDTKCNQNFTIINEVILSEQLHDERNDRILTRILNGDTSLIDYANGSLLVDELNCDFSTGDEIKTSQNSTTKVIELERIVDGNEFYLRGTIEHTESNSYSQTHFIKIRPGKNSTKPIRIWECGICKKEFQHQYTLMRHLPTHTDIRKYVCKVCGKAFRQMSTLSQHKAIHTNIRPHSCNVCNKAFNRISTLISHKRTHSEIKPYKCPICEKGFHQKGNMRNHVFTHTNERPYKCDKCSKGFNQMSNLMWHKVHIHGNSKCSVCCAICHMMFEQQDDLEKHKMEQHLNCFLENSDKSNFDENFNNCIIISQNQNEEDGDVGINWNRMQYEIEEDSNGSFCGDTNDTTINLEFIHEPNMAQDRDASFYDDKKTCSALLNTILKAENNLV